MKPGKTLYFIIIALIILLLLIFILSYFISIFETKANSASSYDTCKINTDSSIKNKSPKTDTLLTINNRKVFIKVPSEKRKGVFLMLHGWNLPADDWCTKTSICDKVTKLGFYVVLPDMGKSLYQDINYPETRADMLIYPTRSWLSDTLIPLLKKDFGLLIENDNNYIVGLSTGARGVALVLLDFPYLFKGAAALSGDYDQVKLPTDRLVTAFYGAFGTYKERWQKIDNPVFRINEFKTPIYLGHGKKDKVVPPEQTIEFYDSLKKYHPALKIKLNMPEAAHDYNYWDSEVDNIINFFAIK